MCRFVAHLKPLRVRALNERAFYTPRITACHHRPNWAMRGHGAPLVKTMPFHPGRTCSSLLPRLALIAISRPLQGPKPSLSTNPRWSPLPDASILPRSPINPSAAHPRNVRHAHRRRPSATQLSRQPKCINFHVSSQTPPDRPPPRQSPDPC